MVGVPLCRLEATLNSAQVALTPFLCGLYLVRPQLLHRFVGYLEETAVHTYTNIVTTALTPGTRLHTTLTLTLTLTLTPTL